MNNWKEGDPLPPSSNLFFSEETESINKTVRSVHLWYKLNEIIIGTIAFLIIMFFALIDSSIMPHNSLGEISLLIWIPNEVFRISGVVFLVILEDKGFKKLLKRKFPLAYN